MSAASSSKRGRTPSRHLCARGARSLSKHQAEAAPRLSRTGRCPARGRAVDHGPPRGDLGTGPRFFPGRPLCRIRGGWRSFFPEAFSGGVLWDSVRLHTGVAPRGSARLRRKSATAVVRFPMRQRWRTYHARSRSIRKIDSRIRACTISQPATGSRS